MNDADLKRGQARFINTMKVRRYRALKRLRWNDPDSTSSDDSLPENIQQISMYCIMSLLFFINYF